MKQVLVKPYYNSLIKEVYHAILFLITPIRYMENEKNKKPRSHQKGLGQK